MHKQVNIRAGKLWGMVLLLIMTAPSAFAFDCHNAENAAEKTICSVSALKKMDRQLNINYKMARSGLSAEQQAKLRTSQLKWLRARNQCKTNIRCIRANYQSWFTQFNKYKHMMKE